MKTLWAVTAFLGLALFHPAPAVALTGVSLQVHNPTGGSPTSLEPSDVKSQFIMRNDSDTGVKIISIFWEFQDPVFIDSASGAPGFGGYRNYLVSPAQTYGGTGSGEFEVTVGANSDVTTGYTGPTSFSDGAKSLLLTFNSFDAGESFGFWTDLDTANDTTGRVGNKDFNGSKTTVKFSDGSEIVFDWQLPNNTGRSFYAQISGGGSIPVPEPATALLLGSGLLASGLRRRFGR